MASFLDSLAAGRTLDGFDAEETELLLRAAVDLLPQEPAMRVSEWLDGATAEPGEDSFDFDFGSGSDELSAEIDDAWLTDFGDGPETAANPLEDDDDLGEWDDTWSLGEVDDHGPGDDLHGADQLETGLGHHHDLSDPRDLHDGHGSTHHED